MMPARRRLMSRFSFEAMLNSYFFWMPAPLWCYRYSWEWSKQRAQWELVPQRKTREEHIYLIFLTDGNVVQVFSSIFNGSGSLWAFGRERRVRLHLSRASDLQPLGVSCRMNRVDTPNKPFPRRFRENVESILYHTGYFSCMKCEVCKGAFIIRKTVKGNYVFSCENVRSESDEHDHPVGMKGSVVQAKDVPCYTPTS